MICSKCKEPGVLNHANNHEFWYCRKCREEIIPESVPAETPRNYSIPEIAILVHSEFGFEHIESVRMMADSCKQSYMWPFSWKSDSCEYNPNSEE